MSAWQERIGVNFRRMSSTAIAVILFIMILHVLDLVFHLGWGYKANDLKVGLLVLIFALILRFLGLRVIALFRDSY